VAGKLDYLLRLAAVYGPFGASPLDFWHETPEAHPGFHEKDLGPYYMAFASKAAYRGPFDDEGIPLLDYRGRIGRQYNPIAVAQYGLARYNRWLETRSEADKGTFLRQADWLVRSLETTPEGRRCWLHHFDFEYRGGLRAPWRSGLAQGCGLSLLARAHQATKEARYQTAMDEAFAALAAPVEKGGTLFREGEDSWIEEYIVDPPSHILNGFIWALWGARDYHLSSGSPQAKALWEDCLSTLRRNLSRFDTSWWSLYELGKPPMLASAYYHRLHIVQLDVLHRLTGIAEFESTARRWQTYARNPINRARSFAQKAAFKLLHY
jgi:hypothetical protein